MTESVRHFPEDRMRQRLEQIEAGLGHGGEPPDNGGMEARVAKLESAMEYVQRDLADIKGSLRGHDGKFDGLRDRMDSDFRLTWGAIIIGFIGLAGLMAKGFGWLD
jgi:hypothetical protein